LAKVAKKIQRHKSGEQQETFKTPGAPQVIRQIRNGPYEDQKAELKRLVDVGVDLAIFKDPENQKNEEDEGPSGDEWARGLDLTPIRESFDCRN
jgi:hypothetical protein